MAFFLPGNLPIASTFVEAANPSTATLLAELDSSNFRLNPQTPAERTYQVHAYLSGSTAANWVVESATSTALSATVDRYLLRTSPQQTAQFVLAFRLTAQTDRIRVRHYSTNTGTYEAKLVAQEIG
jgi:hypothetical protein